MRTRLLQAVPAAVTGLVVVAGLHLLGVPAAPAPAPTPTVDLSDIQLAVANPALDIFVEFTPAAGTPSVKGESTSKAHGGLVEAASVHFAATNKSTVGSASSGAGVGKAQFDELVLTKGLDLASAPLFLASATGTHYTKVVIIMDRVGTTTAGQVALRITLGTVFINRVDISTLPAYAETVNLAFGAAKLEYFVPNAQGLSPAKATNVQSWSIIDSKQVPDL